MQRPPHRAGGEVRISRCRLISRALRIDRHDRVDVRIDPLDLPEARLQQLDRRQLATQDQLPLVNRRE